jgi:alpha-methylacyl-CoA racemase
VTGPLHGITVVELAAIGPVPFAGMILAGMGADVLLVDRPNDAAMPDLTRAAVGRGKRSIVVDLKQPDGVAIVRRLARDADVLIEGLRPGVTERLGVGPEDCHRVNPALVYGRTTGWGRSGAMVAAAGHDINYIGLVGALAAIGPDDRPIPPLNLVGDYGGGGMYLVAGVLAALLDRNRSGGRIIDVAMVDGAASLMSPISAMSAAGAWSRERSANLLDGGSPFYTTYATSDGSWMAVGALEPQFYDALLEGLGLDGSNLPDRSDRDRWPELRHRIASVFSRRTRSEWETVFADSDACVTPVLDLIEAKDHAVNLARHVYGADGLAAPAPRFDDDAPEAVGAAPTPGQQTDEILNGLGFTGDEIAALRRGGAIA